MDTVTILTLASWLKEIQWREFVSTLHVQPQTWLRADEPYEHRESYTNSKVALASTARFAPSCIHTLLTASYLGLLSYLH